MVRSSLPPLVLTAENAEVGERVGMELTDGHPDTGLSRMCGKLLSWGDTGAWVMRVDEQGRSSFVPNETIVRAFSWDR